MAATVVKATDIAPTAFKPAVVDAPGREDDLLYDLGNLVASDPHAVDVEALKRNPEQYLAHVARDGTQLLVNRVFDLPTERTPEGPLAQLPAPSTVLPREKRMPDLAPETRWEKFAKAKGIKNKKKERMLWDEQTQEWRPRWGYKRANDDTTPWLIEHKSTDDPHVDPYTVRRVAKKQRVVTNELQHLANLQKATGMGAKGLKAEALRIAQRSTASMGKFDAARPGEPKKKGRKSKPITSTGDERAAALAILDRVVK